VEAGVACPDVFRPPGVTRSPETFWKQATWRDPQQTTSQDRHSDVGKSRSSILIVFAAYPLQGPIRTYHFDGLRVTYEMRCLRVSSRGQISVAKPRHLGHNLGLLYFSSYSLDRIAWTLYPIRLRRVFSNPSAPPGSD
jgi:hypothetical protein